MLAIAISGLTAFASDETVSKKVLDAFGQEFVSAKEVTWTTGANYYRAQFSFNGQQVAAYYSVDGELIGLTRNITSLDLPINLQVDLKKHYADYWISDLFEVTRSDSTGYYITLENADTSIVLKASADSDWSVFRKAKKI